MAVPARLTRDDVRKEAASRGFVSSHVSSSGDELWVQKKDLAAQTDDPLCLFIPGASRENVQEDLIKAWQQLEQIG